MSIFRKAAKHIWVGVKYWTFRLVSYVTGKLPLRFSYWAGAVVGDVVYLTWKQHSANAVSNMRRVMGDSADWKLVKETARDSFRNYAKTLVDFLRYPYLDSGDIRRAIPLQHGWENLEKARSKGKGVIVISGHIGNWDMAGALLGSRGLPLHAVADSFEPKRMDDLINGTRERSGINIIKMETNSLKQIFTALKHNEIVMLLFDRPQPNEGVPVQFFGETAWLPTGPAAIALKTRSAIVVGYCTRKPGNKTFYGAFEPPIDYEPLLTGDKERDIQIITQEIVTRMEGVIRHYPDQWYMFRQMWPRTDRHDAEVKRRRWRGGSDSGRTRGAVTGIL
ncbi:MAG: lysophospholipid acyltransferase family protein [Chloroflexi bacterium]|nr:lysophospholipid acyltransferase family protein [Chloroflexota bacterium]